VRVTPIPSSELCIGEPPIPAVLKSDDRLDLSQLRPLPSSTEAQIVPLLEHPFEGYEINHSRNILSAALDSPALDQSLFILLSEDETTSLRPNIRASTEYAPGPNIASEAVMRMDEIR
jgi:hypothetical protein